jgi:type IV secretion system protein VirB2
MKLKITRCIASLSLGALALIPVLAFAAAPFTAAASGLTTDVMTIITPLAGLAVIVIGLLALINVIHWAWLGGALIGMGLIFGNAQVVAWFRGLMGV